LIIKLETVDSSPIYSNWENISELYNCTNWTPDSSLIIIGQNFEQQRECQIDQKRNKQNRLQSSNGTYKNDGGPILEYRTEIVTETKNNTGLLEQWVLSTPIYSEWVNSGSIYDCTNWTPSENTINKGEVFTQTATDCKQNQTRTRQDREQEITTLAYRDVGSLVDETNVLLGQINTRSSIGTMENWIAASPIYSEWINSGSLYDCTNWSPDPSTVNSGVSFTQTATNCKQNQTRTKQEREQDTITLAYRNIGELITETNVLNSQSNTRSAIGTKVNKVCKFNDFSSGNGFNAWYGDAYGTYFWIEAYSTIPSLWVDVNTGLYPDFGYGTSPVPNLTKVSGTEFRYNDGSKIWKITRGTFVYNDSGTNYYQVCFE